MDEQQEQSVEAVRRRKVLRRTVDKVQEQNADLSAEDAMRLAD